MTNEYYIEKINKLQEELNEIKDYFLKFKVEEDCDYDKKLFDILYIERNCIAKENKVSAFCILTNDTLKELSKRKPLTIDEFIQIKGIKSAKCEKYGERFIQLIKQTL